MQLNEAVKRQDSTKMNEYLTCERKYFFEYILGYRPDRPIHDLIFGIAFHEAKAILLEEGYSSSAINHAYQAFEEYYRRHFGIDTDLDYVKSPGNVRRALETYVSDYGSIDKFEVIATEVGFSMLIAIDRVMYGRLDAIIKQPDNKYYILETKTAGALWAYTEQSYQQRFQTNTYTNFLYSYYEPKQVGGVITDITIFKKNECVNVRVPIKKTPEQMLGWLTRTNRRFDALERDFNILLQEAAMFEKGTIAPVMNAFPKRESHCIQYNKICSFHDICLARENPLIHAHLVPVGFKIEHWDCTAQKMKSNINLGKE